MLVAGSIGSDLPILGISVKEDVERVKEGRS